MVQYDAASFQSGMPARSAHGSFQVTVRALGVRFTRDDTYELPHLAGVSTLGGGQ